MAAGRLWEDLDAKLDTRLGEGDPSSALSPYIGIASFPRGWSQFGVYYLAGVRRQDAGPPNPALITKQLPAGTYARFCFTAKINELQLILEYVFQTWLPKSDHGSDTPFVVLSYGGKPQPEDQAQIEQQVFVPLS